MRNTKEAPSSIHMQILSWHQQMDALIGPSQSNQLLDASDGQHIHLLKHAERVGPGTRARHPPTSSYTLTARRRHATLRHAASVHARGEQRQIQDGRY
ncbi:hypothetical protein EYF80_024316 [Liparis tanakae]|uniref:Uncharacterized protein n=1 Tax=Liparis tanakae TaxID=230148 RepID=A0A4Z2HI32_9TELE|nr:hypothetical protein EYF80_024316 [Liparis tanakae]